MALQRMAWGLGGASNREDARQHATCATVSNARTKAMHKQPMRCTVQYSHSAVSQHRAKEIIDDPPLKAFVDRNRKRNGKAAINYPQPTEL
jgi:hypothetical protein